MYDLTKSQKKIARQIIEKGLRQDYINGILKVKKIVDSWNKDDNDQKDTYLKLYSTVIKHDKQISRKYDSLTGSRYVLTIMTQLSEGLITREDLEGFPDDLKQKIIKFVEGNF